MVVGHHHMPASLDKWALYPRTGMSSHNHAMLDCWCPRICATFDGGQVELLFFTHKSIKLISIGSWPKQTWTLWRIVFTIWCSELVLIPTRWHLDLPDSMNLQCFSQAVVYPWFEPWGPDIRILQFFFLGGWGEWGKGKGRGGEGRGGRGNIVTLGSTTFTGSFMLILFTGPCGTWFCFAWIELLRHLHLHLVSSLFLAYELVREILISFCLLCCRHYMQMHCQCLICVNSGWHNTCNLLLKRGSVEVGNDRYNWSEKFAMLRIMEVNSSFSQDTEMIINTFKTCNAWALGAKVFGVCSYDS